MVAYAVTAPIEQRVLDPSCGSGTFLFHAVRAHMAAAEAGGLPVHAAVRSVTAKVFGIDLHPVAVTFARVTYLLAIGKAALQEADRGPITVPVYLGDSVQWEQNRDLLTSQDTMVVSAAGDELVQGGAATLFDDDPDLGRKLKFPTTLLADAQGFDRLVTRMANAAQDTTAATDRSLVEPVFNAIGVHEHDRPTLRETFKTMRELHKDGRDHIWGYYVRNLLRPLWLSSGHRVDVLIGNPPWLRYSKMTPSMQTQYKTLARQRSLLTGGAGASGRDLSTLFVVRSVELYLRGSGSFCFVMPHGVMSRRPHHGFRTGDWSSKSVTLKAAFEQCWDLDKVTTGFPITSCVVHGKPSNVATPMPPDVELWSGRLSRPDVSWAVAAARHAFGNYFNILKEVTYHPLMAEML